MEPWQRTCGRFRITDCAAVLHQRVRPLGNALEETDHVSHVFELCITGAALANDVELRVLSVAEITDPLPQPKRQRASAAAAPDGDGASSQEEDLAGDASDCDSSISGCSVDTDVDTDVDIEAKRVGAKFIAKLKLDEFVPAPVPADAAAAASAPAVLSESEDTEDDAQCGKRHAAGTWKTWSNSWFYLTHTAGEVDIKMHLYGTFRKPPPYGMGAHPASKTLRPHRFGETVDNCWRTQLLLEAWALWRARLNGWSDERDGRKREVAAQSIGIVQRLVSAHDGRPAEPLLGSSRAHDFLKQHVPLEVARALAAAAPPLS